MLTVSLFLTAQVGRPDVFLYLTWSSLTHTHTKHYLTPLSLPTPTPGYYPQMDRPSISSPPHCLRAVLPHCLCAVLPYYLCAVLPYCLCAVRPYCLCAVLPHCLCAVLPHCPCAVLPYCLCAVLPYCLCAVLPHCLCAVRPYYLRSSPLSVCCSSNHA